MSIFPGIHFLKCQEVTFFKELPHCPPHRDCPSLHSLQPYRRFPDLQASSAFMILLVGSLLIVIDWHEVMHHCSFVLHFLLFSAGEHLSFPSCPSKRASCPTQAQQLWRTGLVAPKHVEYSWTRDQARVPGTVRWIFHHWVTRLFSFFSF